MQPEGKAIAGRPARTVSPSAARWTTAIGGLGFVCFFVVGATLYGSGAGRDSDEIVAYYSQQANRLAQIEGFAIVTAGLVLLAAFVAGLRAVATHSEPWSSLMFGSGMATVVCLVMANTLWASSAFTTVIERGYVIDVYWYLPLFAFLVWIVLVSIVSLRSGAQVAT